MSKSIIRNGPPSWLKPVLESEREKSVREAEAEKRTVEDSGSDDNRSRQKVTAK